LTGLLTQSATEAPSGRVTIYAHQNAKTLLRRKRQAPKAGTAITIANSTIDPTNPKCSWLAVRSQAARPVNGDEPDVMPAIPPQRQQDSDAT
jgi:hypothetical protein